MKMLKDKKVALAIILLFFIWGGISYVWAMSVYTITDPTWEVVVMLLVTFLLGVLFRHFWGSTYGIKYGGNTDTLHKFATMKRDDLKIIEGIGPKIEDLLKANGMAKLSDLAASDSAGIKEVLRNGGERFQMHDPSSWADQAALAVESKWADLEEYQNLLIGGRAD